MATSNDLDNDRASETNFMWITMYIDILRSAVAPLEENRGIDCTDCSTTRYEVQQKQRFSSEGATADCKKVIEEIQEESK